MQKNHFEFEEGDYFDGKIKPLTHYKTLMKQLLNRLRLTITSKVLKRLILRTLKLHRMIRRISTIFQLNLRFLQLWRIISHKGRGQSTIKETCFQERCRLMVCLHQEYQHFLNGNSHSTPLAGLQKPNKNILLLLMMIYKTPDRILQQKTMILREHTKDLLMLWMNRI